MIKKIKLCVAALTGTAYLSAIDKKGCMTDNRRELDHGEILKFIHEWAEAESERLGDNIITITAGGKKVIEITVFKHS